MHLKSSLFGVAVETRSLNISMLTKEANYLHFDYFLVMGAAKTVHLRVSKKQRKAKDLQERPCWIWVDFFDRILMSLNLRMQKSAWSDRVKLTLPISPKSL